VPQAARAGPDAGAGARLLAPADHVGARVGVGASLHAAMKTVLENTEEGQPPRRPAPAAPPHKGLVPAAPEEATEHPDQAWAYEVAHPESSADLTPVVGANLRRLRVRRGLSLERLS